MKKWNQKLDLTDVWNKDWDDTNVSELGQIVAKRLTVLFGGEGELDLEQEDLIDSFEFVDEIAGFDYAMGELYDYADWNRIWIATNF